MTKRGKSRKREEKTREPSLTKGVIGKFRIAHKPNRFDKAKKIELRTKELNGEGTHRGHGSNFTLKMMATSLKGRDKLNCLRKRYRHEKTRSKRTHE